MASVQELILAAQAQNRSKFSPLQELFQTAMSGYDSGIQDQKNSLIIKDARMKLKAQEEAQKIFKAQLSAQEEQERKNKLDAVEGKAPVIPSMKLKAAVSDKGYGITVEEPKAGLDDKRTFQQTTISVDGKPAIARFNTANGEYEIKDTETGGWVPVSSGSIKGQTPKIQTDPASGGLIKVNAAGEVTPLRTLPVATDKKTGDVKPEDAMVNLRSQAPALANRFNQLLDDTTPQGNQFLKEAIDAAGAAAKLKSILSQNEITQVGIKSVGFHLARLSGSNSQLSDREREIFESPLALIDQVVNKGYRITSGDISPKMKQDLIKLSEILEKKNRLQAEKVISAQKKKAASTLGHYYNPDLAAAFPNIDDLMVTAEDIGQAGAQETAGLTPEEQAELEQLEKEMGK